MQPNSSIGYLLVNAFDYELRNYLDIKIAQLAKPNRDLSEEESDELRRLIIVREYLQQRIGAMKS